MGRQLRIAVLAGALIACAAAASAQTVIYVRSGALGGNGSCSLPFGSVAEGLAAAKAGPAPREVRVTEGTYAESGLVIDFSDVAIKGGYPAALPGCPDDAAVEAARDPATLVATIDAAQAGRHVSVVPVTDAGGNFVASNTAILLDGIVLRNGRPAAGGDVAGGSLLIKNCSVRITNCTFRDNSTAGYFAAGGAVYVAGYPAPGPSDFRTAQLDVETTLFENNATGPGGTGAGAGGAIFATDRNDDGTAASRRTTLNLTSVVFRSNTSNGSGDLNAATQCPDVYADANGDGICDDANGDTLCDPPDGIGDANDACPPIDTAGNPVPPNRCHVFAQGGAVAVSDVQGAWQGCTFTANRAVAAQGAFVGNSGNGGAVFVAASADPARAAFPSITGNTFDTNIADAGRGSTTSCGQRSAWGGAACLLNFGGTFSDNVLTGNRAIGTGNAADDTAWGGGAFILPAGVQAVVSGNTFTGNDAVGGVAFNSAKGGGLAIDDLAAGASPVITNNTFAANAVTGNAQVAGYGGGLAVAATGPFPLIAHSVIENNTATGVAGTLQSGWGGGMWARLSSPDALIADNIVRGNSATPLDPTNFPAQFAGIAIAPAIVLDQPDAAPRIQNNLIVDNRGIGLSLFGFALPGTGNLLCGSELIHNTIADNDQAALLTSLANSLRLESNVMWGNDALAQGWGDITDDWLGQGPTNQVVAVTNLIQTLPREPPELLSQLDDPANRNLVGVDPLFATDPAPGGGAYYLRQSPDTGAPFSPLVDYGTLTSGLRDFGANPHYAGENLALRSTSPVTKAADRCSVDVGFHYPRRAAGPDSDGDTIPDEDEILLGSNPGDADSDDDGVTDALECAGDLDGDGLIAALDCDADGDGLPDGLESGLTAADIGPDTDTTATCDTSNAPCGRAGQPAWVEDSEPATTTNPLDRDTDGGGESDGCEDLGRDGKADAPTPDLTDRDESDPLQAQDDDADVDGLTNEAEALLATDPMDRDTDDDGVADGDEIDALDPSRSTDPVACDTDGDGILDGVERSTGPVVVPSGAEAGVRGTDCPPDAARCSSPACFAPDADPATQTQATCAAPPACEGFDTDLDGCGDGQEDVNRNGRVDAGETDPNLGGDCSASADADGDTLADVDERALGTDPNDADTDDDGILDPLDGGGDADGDGLIGPLDCDKDGDGLPDGLETGLTLADIGPATDTTRTCDASNATCGSATQLAFVEDTQPASTTDPLARDTDGGGESDGCEDLDADGATDPPVGPPARSDSDPSVADDDDADVDGLTNAAEALIGSNPLDRDTDDDGVADGEEADLAQPSYASSATSCDTDGDGILDGVERSLGPVAVPSDAEPGVRGTDCPPDPAHCAAAACFAPDMDPATRTYTACSTAGACEGFDTDGDGCSDGQEDADLNGRVDAGETDPNDPGDCPVVSNDIAYAEGITSLVGGIDPGCGLLTTPAVGSLMATPCDAAAPRSGCAPARAIAAPAGTLASGGTFTGGAGYVLVFFESPDCARRPHVTKDAAGTIVVTLQ